MFKNNQDEEEKVRDRAANRKSRRRKIMMVIGVIAVAMILVAFVFNHVYWSKGIVERHLKDEYWMTVSNEGIEIFDFNNDGNCIVKSLEERSGSFFVITEEGEWTLDDGKLEITCDDIHYKGETSTTDDSFKIEGSDREHDFKKSVWDMDEVIGNLLEGTEWKSEKGDFIFEGTGRYWNFGLENIEDNSGIWSIEYDELVLDPDRGGNLRVDIFLKIDSEDGSKGSLQDDGVMTLRFEEADNITFRIKD